MFSSMLAVLPSRDELVDGHVRASLDALAQAWSRQGARSDLVVAAARLAILAHAGQYRRSGELYASHPLMVAATVASWGFDEVSVAAACCHDVLEDCDVDLEALEQELSLEVATVVDGVSKVGKVRLAPGETVESASMTKFLVAVVADVRVLAVKLADRLHNLQTAAALSPDRRERSAREALEVFGPLAHRLGMEDLRREMEDLAFAILHPVEYAALTEHLSATASQRAAIEHEVATELTRLLAEAGLETEVESRAKHLYSIHLKRARTGVSPDTMHDLIGVRAIVPDRDACYQALGFVHAAWTPVPGRFKDFIALPRQSGYQSLHTTVSYKGFEIEIQIRDRAMHLQARYGVAAHYLYKSRTLNRPTPVDTELLEALESASSPEEFLTRLREELAPRTQVVALTPKGRPVTLPAGATIIDFAYKIHTDVGHCCTGAKVNGRIVPIRSEVRTGDIIEVLLGPRPAPRADWLAVVRTSKARERIRRYLSDQVSDPEQAGRALLLDLLRSRGVSVLAEDDVQLSRLAALNGASSPTDLYRRIAAGRISTSEIQGLPERLRPQRTSLPACEVSDVHAALTDALDGLPHAFARCCRPASLRSAFAHVSRHRLVMVHDRACSNAASIVRDLPPGEFSRCIVFHQGASTEWIEVRAADRVGLLRDLSEVLAGLSANIIWSSTETSDSGVCARFRISPHVPLAAALIERTLMSIESVESVETL